MAKMNRIMIDTLKSLFTHPLLRGRDIDDPQTSTKVIKVIHNKSFLKKVYKGWYREILNNIPSDVKGPVLELGAGAGFLKEYIPDLIVSDVLHMPFVDIVLDGKFLPFKRSSLRSIVLIDVFHHISDVKKFLKEVSDCLKPGGVIIMIEPWVTPWSSKMFRYLHHEPFRPKAKKWRFSKGGALTQANSALPWIVFSRDIEIFCREFYCLFVENIRLHTPFTYLISGGVSLRSFVPGFLYGFFSGVEKLLSPWMDKFAMFATIVLVRKE